MISPVVEGGATGAMGDEFVCVNSFCRSHDQEDRPEEGESTAAEFRVRECHMHSVDVLSII